MYATFDLDIPQDLEGALEILASGDGPAATPLAGGTNLISSGSTRSVSCAVSSAPKSASPSAAGRRSATC
jgi:CO/xanthine dehydrogenase FAD-binding subunit